MAKLKANNPTHATLKANAGGGAGTNDYNDLSNKPQINGIVLAGNRTAEDLGIESYDDTEIRGELSDEATARQNADTNLQGQIDAITVSSDVVDIVGTYQELQNYDTSILTDDDIIKVLVDSTHSNAMSYYRWTVTNDVGAWVYVGSEGPFYTKSESDTLLRGKANTSDLANIATSGNFNDLENTPYELLYIDGDYVTLNELFEDNEEGEGKEFVTYLVENDYLYLYIETAYGEDRVLKKGDIIKIDFIGWNVSIISSQLYHYEHDGSSWNGGLLTTINEVDHAIDEATENFVTTNTDQDITGMKTIRSNNGLRFRYGGNYVRMSIKPISTGMAIAYFDSQGNEANNMEFSQGYNTSNKHFLPKDDKTQNLGKSNQVWNNGYINTLSDGTNSVSVSNIATKTELAGKQDTLTAGTGIAITNNVISSTLEGIDYEVDQVLPATGEKGIIYLIPNGSSEQENIYDEYIWIPPLQEGESGRFEFIGTTQTDLTNYVDLDTAQTITGEKTITSAVPLKFAGTYTGQIINQENQLRFKYGGSDKLKISTANITSSAHVIPNSGNTFDLGNSSLKWQHLYLGGSVIWGNSYIQQQGTNIVINPSGSAVHANVDNTKDLGASNRRWRDLYLSGDLSDGTNSTNVANINNNFAPLYDNTSTYAVGDKVIRQGKLYKCNTDISTAEDWDSTKWTEISVVDEIPTNYVTTDTAQDISGSKTFTSAITMKNNSRIKYANSYSSGCSIGNDGSGSMRFFNTYNTGTMDYAGSTLRPATASTNLDLGTSSIQWRDLYLKGNLSDGTNSVAVADIADKDYVDTAIGDIDTALQNLVSGNGVV